MAITDGAYNDGGENGALYRSMQELLLAHPELSLHVVAFGVTKPSEITTLEHLGRDTKGTFYNAPNGARLAESIEKAMKPRKYSIVRDAQPPQVQSASLGEPVEGLVPHAYKVKFPDMPEIPVKIDGGERLEFNLDFATPALKHRRPQPLLFRRAQDVSSFSRQEPIRFGYLKADYDKNTNQADFVFCLDRDDQLGMIERPAEIRIEVNPAGKRMLFTRSWRLAPQQSVPAWQLELSAWPADMKPVIQAFWKMSRTDPDGELPLLNLVKEAQVVTLRGWPEKSLKVTAERQPGKLLVQLEALQNAPGVSVSDVRVELGQPSQIENRFLPTAFNWRSQFFEAQRQLVIEFDVGENLDLETSRIALTSRDALDRGCRTLESPLVIDKWDKEQ